MGSMNHRQIYIPLRRSYYLGWNTADTLAQLVQRLWEMGLELEHARYLYAALSCYIEDVETRRKRSGA